MRTSVLARTVSHVTVLPTSVGHDGIGRDRSPAGDVADTAVLNVVPVSEAQRSQRQIPQDNGVLQMQESPGNLESPLVPRGVRHYGHSDAPRISNHRRLHQGVGSGLRGERRERSLVCDRGRVSYKCVRTADSSPGSTTLSAQTEWSACVSEDTAALAYINRQGGVRSQSLHHWANRLLLCLHPQVIEQIWMRFFRAQVDLFANRQNTCCPLWFSLGGERGGEKVKGAGS